MLEAVAGIAAGGGALWAYNRDNFLYDRELRQEQEFAIFEWRKVQAELWREDVRDIMELTEKKMDSYLIVATLQLGMCCVLFSCGRLGPGTPPWLLHFYMLTLCGAFTYLLMAMWLAIHAGVAAQCASVRMLTQFVRLPVPDWHDFEGARTYAQAYEALSAEDTLRVPFTASLGKGDNAAAASMPRCARGPGYVDGLEELKPSGSDAEQTGDPWHADPWRLEKHGDARGLYELQRVAVELRRHISLARQAALQFQCFDAFARLSMSFGTHQMLYALAHYALGYLAVQDGAFWSAWCVVVIMMCMSAMMMHIDFSMTRIEHLVSTALVFLGLISASAATLVSSLKGVHAQRVLHYVLPLAYSSHGLWLLCALRACGLQEQPGTGAILPMKFRAVLYLDLFGWLANSPAAGAVEAHPAASSTSPSGDLQEPSPELSPQGATPDPATGKGRGSPSCKRHRSRLMEWLLGPRPEPPSLAPAWVPEGRFGMPGAGGGAGQAHQHLPMSSFVKPAEYALLSCTGEVAAGAGTGGCGGVAAAPGCCGAPAQPVEGQPWPGKGLGPGPRPGGKLCRGTGPAGEVQRPPEHAFESTTYGPEGMQDEDFARLHGGREVVTGHDKLRPTRTPARLFRGGTLLLAFLWAGGLALRVGPLTLCGEACMNNPLVAKVFVERIDPETGLIGGEQEVRAVMGTDMNGLPELLPIMKEAQRLPPFLENGRRVRVEWPSHSAFLPRALTCDPLGNYLIVADDFGLYAGRLEWKEPRAADGHSSPGHEKGRLGVVFRDSPRCTAMEGSAFDDIGAFCVEGSGCGVLVLHGGGTAIDECPYLRGDGQAAAADGVGISWRIADDWLRTQKQERVKSLSIRTACARRQAPGLGTPARGLQMQRAGCVVVGTTDGRIVSLDAASAGPQDLLVPQEVLHEGMVPSSTGSLADIPGGFTLALWYPTGTVSAFSQDGQSVGQWRLPKRIRWLMVCAGGDNIFALGVRQVSGPGEEARAHEAPGEEKSARGHRALVELHRFTLPASLRRAADPAPPKPSGPEL